MVQKYQSPVRVYKQPFELVMAVSIALLCPSWLLSVHSCVSVSVWTQRFTRTCTTEAQAGRACSLRNPAVLVHTWHVLCCVQGRSLPLCPSSGTTATPPLTPGCFFPLFCQFFCCAQASFLDRPEPFEMFQPAEATSSSALAHDSAFLTLEACFPQNEQRSS